MKKFLVWLICAMLALSACGTTSRQTEIKITAPVANTSVKVGQSVAIQGIVAGDAISRVDVLVNNELYASLTAPDKAKGVATFPVTVPWTPKQAGMHGLQLKAFSPDDKMLQQSEIIVLRAEPAVVAQPGQVPTSAVSAVQPAATTAPAASGGASGATGGSAPASSTAAPAEEPNITVINEFVNVRKGPGTNYDLLGKLNQGEKAVARGKSADGKWWQISFSSGVGWVLGEYVRANAAAEKLQLAAAPPPPTAVPPTAAPKPQSNTGGTSGDLKALPTAPKP